MVYLVIKELAGTAQDVIMVTSSLMQDMINLPVFKANAIRTLGTVVDSTMISGIERVMKQAMGDSNPSVVSSAMTTAIHFHGENREAVRRWLPEVQAALQGGLGKTAAQYHALGLLYLIKQHDRMALSKLVHQIQSQSTNMMATCLNLAIYSNLLRMDSAISSHPLDLKPFLRLKGKSDMVALEAAKIICQHHGIYAADVVFAVTTLQLFLASSRPLLRFAAIRALNDFANTARDHVAVCNVEIEGLVSDANRNVATLAITTLLKTGNEASVDRLIVQITGYVSEISDEFKIIVVDAVRSLGLKFPAKHKTMLQFLGNVLREEGGLEYKQATVDAVCQLLAKIPAAREPAIAHLCEFIEDCEYPKLTAQVLQLLGEEGRHSETPAKLVRYIYNRLILENAQVRVAAVGALTKLAVSCPSLINGVISILHRCVADEDDEVRDRALVSLCGLEGTVEDQRHGLDQDRQHSAAQYFAADDGYDLAALELQLLDYVQQSEAALAVRPFDIHTVPTLPKAELFEQARQSKSLLSADAVVPVHDVSGGSEHARDNAAGLSARILSVPQFKEFGSLYGSSSAVPLTDAESEYVVFARKHIFEHHLVIEFECRNTVRELLLENVQIQVHINQASGTISPMYALPIPKLPFDDPESCYVAFNCPSYTRPEASFSCSLRFTAIEFDPQSNNVCGRGTTDEYAIESLDLGFADYIRPRDVMDFAADWEALGNHLVETLELPSMSSISEAVKAVTSLVGIRAHRGSDCVVSSASIHSLMITGSLLMPTCPDGAPFALRARFAAGQVGIIVELAVRSTDIDSSTALLGAIC